MCEIKFSVIFSTGWFKDTSLSTVWGGNNTIVSDKKEIIFYCNAVGSWKIFLQKKQKTITLQKISCKMKQG